MPELRQDIVTGRWVVVATDRAKRPESFSQRRIEMITPVASCPFCLGHEDQTPPEVDAIRDKQSKPDNPGWSVRVVPNKYPAFTLAEEQLNDETPYCYRQALGVHEVIIHSPEHGRNLGSLPVKQVELVINMYQKRYQAAMAHPQVKSTIIIVNHGREAGASLEHSHSQLFAMPLIPQEVKDEISGMGRYLEERGECVFCNLISNEYRNQKRLVAENERFVAFCPYASRGPFEVWLLPKNHLSSFEAAEPQTLAQFAQILHQVLKMLKERLSDPPYNYWLHTRPQGSSEFHWHLEILPKLFTPAGFEFGTGVMINVVKPEDAAAYLAGK